VFKYVSRENTACIMFKEYDIIVVGAGHAGCEAAAAAARLGSSVLLITMDMNKIAQMSCNPAMGGVAKGQIVREIDALGGLSGIVTDRTMIQFRMLNRSKGPAVWSPRAQSDRAMFSLEWRSQLEAVENLDFWQDTVTNITVESAQITGVITSLGYTIKCKSLILTNGTFLNGLIHIGLKQFGGGRMADKASFGITEALQGLGFESGRMKTGTPPRVDGRSLDYTKMEVQAGDEEITGFSYLEKASIIDPLCCWITYTNQEVHDVLKEGFEESPMYSGRIQGLGPRYCPSIEDKINRFADRERHQIFVEPEGRKTVEIYVNGFSTSLPEHIQMRALRLIPGFKQAKMFRPGYAIEYDYFPPTQLKQTLETKLIKHLYFAGQINGTTGYEEAASQGLMAGINAHLKLNDQEPLILKRSEAYIGVLIDDLVNKGTDEPYRMFTSRAEYRILLRQDNADIRLTEMGYKIKLASKERMMLLDRKIKASTEIINFLHKESIAPEIANPYLEQVGSAPLNQAVKANTLIQRPHVEIKNLVSHTGFSGEIFKQYSDEEIFEAEIQIKYEGYIKREKELAEKVNRLEYVAIPDSFNYDTVKNISSEAREKLNKIKPQNIGQASRISGINPADISVLLIHLGR
jgi:tRNA uridine 5-carboxymethylaminomethyl modification enzyme